jgi:hypothetical protein
MRFGNFSPSELVAALAALVGIPFYLGFAHFSGTQLLLYSGLAGTGMAAGEYLETPSALRGDWKSFAQAATLWIPLATLIGGLVYLAALLF